MLDVRALQNDFDAVAARLSLRNLDRNILNELRELAFDTKETRKKLEECQTLQNEKSRLFGQ